MTPNPQDSAVALEVELLPCPFCGGAGEAFDVHTLTWHVRYGCQSCQVFFNDAETWNRRASQSDGTSGKEMEALRDQRDALMRALEVIAVGDSPDPVTDAGDELVALGYWRKEGLDGHRAAPNQGENHG